MSGHEAGLPDLPGVRTKGRVGEDVSIEEGYATARAVMLMNVASLKQFTSDLDHLKRVFRLFWHGQMGRPTSGAIREVMDGATDFVYALWGPGFGQHARTAIGASGLPRDITVGVNGEFEIAD